ncbi:SPOR domain-containing protein [Gemmobacter sp.]|uniref:SPOR domain-containing protein n=1 Tax=Gemmobacter sp. TaxID=1898957 RepID=UPI0025C70CAC|nr:SPOR domain-containing protein [Gemmobacter sp.]
MSQIGGPKEQPPAGFKGQMYVDSRGCVFLRAGLNGNTSWVPRVSRDRKALCGYPPTAAAMARPVEVATPAEIAAPARVAEAAPAPRATGKPLNTVASVKTPPSIRAAGPSRPVDPYLARALPAQMAPQGVVVAPAPVVVAAAAPRQGAEVVMPATRLSGNRIGCYQSAPVPRVVALSNGGSAVLCTKGDGSLVGLRAPVYAKVAMGEGNRVGAGLYEPAGVPVARGNISADQLGNSHRTTVVVSHAAPVASAPGRVVVRSSDLTNPPVVVPEGYKLAWRDDRLNPYRGMGTAQGQAQQDQVWTRQVPAQLQGQNGRIVVSSKGQAAAAPVRLRVSSKSEPQAQVTPVPQVRAVRAGGLYVQVGTFGVPANAEGARARLRAAGLPTGTAQVNKGGKALQMVMAGPFGDAGSAQAALNAARAAGFGDAYIR